MKIIVTGPAGFIEGYLIDELLDHGHQVVEIDNYSKYGRVEKNYYNNPKICKNYYEELIFKYSFLRK